MASGIWVEYTLEGIFWQYNRKIWGLIVMLKVMTALLFILCNVQ